MTLFRLFCTATFLLITTANSYSQNFDGDISYGYYDKAHKFLYENTDSASYYANKLLDYGIKHNDSITIGQGYHTIAYTYYYKNNFQKALEYFKITEKIFTQLKMPEDLGIVYMDFGNMYSDMGQLEICLKHYKKAERLMKDYSRNPEDLAILYYNMAHVFMDLHDLKNLTKYIDKAIDYLAANNLDFMDAPFNNMKAFLAIELGNTREALIMASDALAASKLENDRIETIFAFQNLGRANIRLGKIDTGFAYLDSSLAEAKLFEDEFIISTELAINANEYLNNGFNKKADSLAREAYHLGLKQNSLLITLRVCDVYAKTLEVNGEFKEAIKVYRKYTVAHDSVNSFSLNEKILEAENELSQQKNALLMAEATLLRTNNSKNRMLMLGTSIALVLSLIIIVLMILNLSARKKTAQKLKDKQKIIDAKGVELEKKNKELKKINDGKDMLFSVITHDMKQPFNQVSSFIELLKAEGSIDDSLKKLLDDIKESTEATLASMNNLLLWSKAQFLNIKTEPEKVKVKNVLQSVIAEFGNTIDTKSLTLQTICTESSSAFVDKIHLEIILRNLLSNAIKFSSHNSTIEIRVSIQNRETSITVKDYGKGMTTEEVNQLFDKQKYFSTPGTLNEKGTGIGMLLVMEYIQENNGEIHVESTLNEGSSFTVKFPNKV